MSVTLLTLIWPKKYDDEGKGSINDEDQIGVRDPEPAVQTDS
jgi:hypothetical protein